MSEQTPAGWYPDPDNAGGQRYWDGQEWTDSRVDYPATPGVTHVSSGKSRKGLIVAAGLGGAVLLLVGLAVVGGGEQEEAKVSATKGSAASTPTATPSPTPSESETTSEDNYYPWPSSYTTLTDRQWKKIVRDPDRYAGKGVIVYAEVFQFDAATGRKAFLGNASYQDERSYGFWSGDDTTAFVSPDKRTVRNVVEDDVVRVKAVVDSSYSYETQIGGNTTVPLLYIHKIGVIGSTD